MTITKSPKLPERYLRTGPITTAVKEFERQKVANKFALGNSINMLRAKGVPLPPTPQEICGLANAIANREKLQAQPERRGTVWASYVQDQLRAKYPALRIRVTIHAQVWRAKLSGDVSLDIKFQGRHDPIAFLSEKIDTALKL